MNKSEEFLRKVNQAFAEGDKNFLLDSVTSNFCWNVVGEKQIAGKEGFSDALDRMQEMPPMSIRVDKVISTERSAVVEGIVTGKNRLGQKKHFSFCDIYELDNAGDPKIREMTSYVIDVSKHKQYKENT